MGTNLRISALTAGSTFSTLDLIPFVDVSDVSISDTGKTKKGTLADFVTYLNTVVTGLPTTNASLLTSGTVAFARLPVGTSSTSVAQGNHLHTGVYDPAGTAALITPSTLGLVIGTNVLAYSASTGTGSIVRAAGATLTGATLTTATIDGSLNTISNVPFTALSGNIATTQLPGGGVNSANELVQLTAAGKYPALDGSLITNLSSGFTNPMTTLGDVLYGGASGTATRLAGNTTSTRKFLKSLGSAGAATAPSYDTLLAADVGLGSVENTALSSWTGSTSIETVGEIITGTWHGAAIDLANYSTGILPNTGFPATLPVASGVNLTALNASNLTSGTVPSGRIDFSGYQTLLTDSAGLRAALSDETGTGAAVFATSPTLVTPVLGVATATTINKLQIIAPATGAQLDIGDGNVFSTRGNFAEILRFTATTDITMPTTGTVATLTGSEAFTNKTYNGNIWTAGTGTLTQAAGSTFVTVGAFSITLTATATTALTLPTTGTLATRAGAETLTNKTFSSGCVVPVELIVACGDETTAASAGTGKVTFRMPYAMTVTAVRLSAVTAPTGGTLLTVDINEAGVSILSTKLTLDASEKTSTTAATAAVISDASLADDAEMSIDFDAVGSTIAGAGIKVAIIGTRVLP